MMTSKDEPTVDPRATEIAEVPAMGPRVHIRSAREAQGGALGPGGCE